MIHVLKSLVYYPVHFIGVFLQMLGTLASWFCFVGMFLFGAVMLAGELPDRWDLVVGLGVVGVVIRLLMALYIRMLAMLNPAWDGPR